MYIKILFKKLFNLFGFKISRITKKANFSSDHRDAFKMQKFLINEANHELTIFDVGAFQGAVSLKYNELFPESKIFCFEPSPDSFSILNQNTYPFKNIITINKGLSDHVGFSKFHMNRFAPTNSILKTHKLGKVIWGEGLLDTSAVIDVELTTIDNFVKTHAIEKIDILKMDVQGAEFMVINGAKKSLKKGIIKMIYTEIITLPTYEGQLQFDQTIQLIRSNGFDFFNLYNYSLTKDGQLRQVDAIFVKSTLHKD